MRVKARVATGLNPEKAHSRPLARRALQMAANFVLWALLLFGGAGTIDYARGWLYLGLYATTFSAAVLVVLRKNPDIIAARAKNRADAKAFDKRLMRAYGVLALAIPTVAACDAVRFGWTSMPAWTAIPGALLFIASAVPLIGVLATNPFAETLVRIQSDRGHRVVSNGPYAYVRHPMYTGILGQSVAAPLILGSWWAFVPVALLVLLLIVRTSLEDRFLRAELTGYEEYARKVVYRLFPYIW